MFTTLFAHDTGQGSPREGDLYKRVTVAGRTFELFYGYYEDFERFGKYNDPIPIYPDFISAPEYTEDGIPYVTKMQDICRYYQGNSTDDSCAQCAHFQIGDDLIGLCRCSQKRRHKPSEDTV